MRGIGTYALRAEEPFGLVPDLHLLCCCAFEVSSVL
jgi:hypothetical protein